MILNLILSFFISFFGTIPYAARIVGVKTKLLALTFSLFSIMMLVSRTSAGFQAPFLAKFLELKLIGEPSFDPTLFFRMLLLSSSAGCILGIAFIPFTQRLFTEGVKHYYNHRSFYKILKTSCTINGLKYLVRALKPAQREYKITFSLQGMPVRLLIMHSLATALFTTGVLSAMYAGFFNPYFRNTAVTLTFVIHGIATIIMFVIIDPPISILTDDCIHGKIDEEVFGRTIYWLVISRIAGTFIAQLLFIPCTYIISLLATHI